MEHGSPRPSGDSATSSRGRPDRWTGADVAAALNAATELFEPHVAAVNALNVFPVPDGDTGTNMFLTLRSASHAAGWATRDHPGAGAGAILAAAAHGALMGARGNSGVILYQILAGLAEATRDAIELDGSGLAAGLDRAAVLAYRAVMAPVEGTMLTVIRVAAVAASAAASRPIATVLAAGVEGASDALRRTPEMLDILRQAGVVDAGGQGLVHWLDGLRRYAAGMAGEVQAPAGETAVSPAMRFLDLPQVVHDIDEFGYCTNFIVTGTAPELEEFRGQLGELGTSAVVVGDTDTLKVHVHSEHPGHILELALRYGELHEVRIDNMAAQTRKLMEERAAAKRHGGAAAVPPVARIAVVAVAGGEGLTSVFRGMGADAVVPAGSTFNPSTAEIAAVVEQVPQEEVIILPNDANVVPTARQVEKLTGRRVRIVPSRSIPQGISALAAFNFEAPLDVNVAAMSEALGLVRSIALSRASRTVEIGGVRAVAGEFIGFLDGLMRAAGSEPVPVVTRVLDDAGVADAELVTLFVGEPAAPDLAEDVARDLRVRYPELTVEVVRGGQPHYDLIISVE
ncbi:MAG TPA: DAK2 domain-containing protein [Thermomicrobiaceae bacterium]|nr:DAK2 domain-containing protein [Thermomicrobiaceae bacterium]